MRIIFGTVLAFIIPFVASAELDPLFSAANLHVMAPIYKQLTSDTPSSIANLRAITADLNGDGDSEAIIKDQSQCSASFHCRIVVGHFDQETQKWRMIGDSYGHTIKLGEPQDAFRDLTVVPYINGQETYLSYQEDSYRRDLSRYGDLLVFSDVKEAFMGKEDYLQRVLARGLGSGYQMIQQASSDDDRAVIAGADLNYDGEHEYIIYADYAAICDSEGCPVLLFSDLGKKPFAVVHSPSTNIAISHKVESGKLKTVVTEEGEFNWTSVGYQFESAAN